MLFATFLFIAASAPPGVPVPFPIGTPISGDQHFRLDAPGEHIVEVHALFAPSDRYSISLEAAGKLHDTRFLKQPLRLGPSNNPRVVRLLAVARGGEEIVIRSDFPSYEIVTVRATPRAGFEQIVPALIERLRRLQADPFFENLRAGRASRMVDLGELASRTSNPALRQEALIHLTRGVYWIAAENHQPRDIARLDELLRECAALMPGNPIVRQMISTSCSGLTSSRPMASGPYCSQAAGVPWPLDLPSGAASAPAWALSQLKLRLRMDAITRWWVEKRQAPNGELGGGWGDDVEVLRQWGPLALGLSSSVASEGIRRVADGLWSSGQLLNGYDKDVSDVEHSSEPTTDTLPLRAAIAPADPQARARLAESAACAPYWITRQPDGFWRFRSSWFNCREADLSPKRAVDVHLNTRAMGPALWHAYLSRDPQLIALLANWGEAWARAARSTGSGKPAGIFPSVLSSSDGSYLIGTDRWDKPQAEWDYFQWSGGSHEALTSLMLALHDLTGESKWLTAAGETFSVLKSCSAHAGLCREIIAHPEAFYEWRRRSSDSAHDKLFNYQPEPSPDEILRRMTQMAQAAEQRIAHNFDMFTTEVIFTDRIYYPLPAEYKQYLFGGEAPRGDRSPFFHVTWSASDPFIARAVLHAAPQSFSARLYNFDSRESIVRLRFWRLKPGSYSWKLGGLSGLFRAASLPHDFAVPVPPRAGSTLEIAPATP